MRGVLYTLTDLELMSDSIHRGGGQTLPAARRLYYGLQLAGKPILLEPCMIFSLPTHP